MHINYSKHTKPMKDKLKEEIDEYMKDKVKKRKPCILTEDCKEVFEYMNDIYQMVYDFPEKISAKYMVAELQVEIINGVNK